MGGRSWKEAKKAFLFLRSAHSDDGDADRLSRNECCYRKYQYTGRVKTTPSDTVEKAIISRGSLRDNLIEESTTHYDLWYRN